MAVSGLGFFLVHFSICACHPCAGAMLIFSVSFQFYRMIPEFRAWGSGHSICRARIPGAVYMFFGAKSSRHCYGFVFRVYGLRVTDSLGPVLRISGLDLQTLGFMSEWNRAWHFFFELRVCGFCKLRARDEGLTTCTLNEVSPESMRL